MQLHLKNIILLTFLISSISITAKNKRPNVIIINTDNQSTIDINCSGIQIKRWAVR